MAQQAPATTRARAQWQLGQGHAKRGHWDQAVRAFAAATQLAPQDALYALNHARAQLAAGRLAEAAAEAQRAFALDTSSAVACALAAHCLMEAKQFRPATQCLRQLDAHVERGHDYHFTLARSLQLGGQPREAIVAFFDALAIKIDDANTHYQLGVCFNDLRMKEEASQCFQTALAMGVGEHELGVRGLLSYFEREACNWDGAQEALAQLRAAVHRLPADAAIATAPFAHVTLFDDPLEQLIAARSLARHLAGNATPPRTRRRSDWAPAKRRLRVGYVSCDFHEHATSILMAEVLEQHDREQFEVTLYAHDAPDGSRMRARIEAACEHFIDVRAESDREVAERVRAEGIDLLIDLKGYTKDHRLGIFAWQAAPVQATFLGFPGSTGAHYIDYLIGDPIVTPLEHAAHYTEKIAQMPVCYQPNDRQRALPPVPARSQHGLPDGAVVLAGFNQPYKISAEVFDSWCRILHAGPNTVLWLLEWNEQSRINLTREAQARGVDSSRLVWAPRMAPADHMARMQLADVFVDTWPCNAHTTASDALWAGVPVVTWAGRTFASRVAASLVHAAGLPELACRDAAHYEASVIALAHDAARRAALHQHLVATRGTSVLFDSLQFVRDLEALFVRMLEHNVQGRPVQALTALPAVASGCAPQGAARAPAHAAPPLP